MMASGGSTGTNSPAADVLDDGAVSCHVRHEGGSRTDSLPTCLDYGPDASTPLYRMSQLST